MRLFRRKKNIEDLDYDLVNEYYFGGIKVHRLLTILLVLLIISVSIYLLNKLNILPIICDILCVISPIFIGLFLAWLLVPLCDKMSKKMPRIVSCILVYVIVIGIISLIMTYTIPNLVDQVKLLSKSVPDMINESQKFINKTYERFHLSDNDAFITLKKNFFTSIKNIDTTNIFNQVVGGTMSVVGVITNIFLGLMIGFYMLFDYHKMQKQVKKFIPDRFKSDVRELSKRINSSLRGYVQGVLLVMGLVFLTQTIGLSLAGHKAPLLFALICAITDVIPYFGPWIGGVPAVIVGFLISPLTGIFTIISILVVQVLEGNIYQPLIMGHTLKLHPVTIMIALLLFGHFFGIIGMIVATPLTATFKVLFEFIDEKIEFMKKVENS